MPEAQVLYSEVQFESRARRCTNAITSSSDQTTYSEVRIVESEAAAELPVSQQGAAELKGPAQVRRRDVALLVLSLLLAAAVSALAASLNKNVQTMDQLQKLQFDHEALKRNLSVNQNVQTKDQLQKLQFDLEALKRNLSVELQKLQSCNEDLEGKVSDELCLTCDGDWEQHGGRCYWFSSIPLSWFDSKSSCTGQGGDLVKIDSREEQTFLQNKVRERQKHDEEKFWIGLADLAKEGRWIWRDGSPLDKSLSLWGRDQPDDSKLEDHDGEDCVMMGEKWWDDSCKDETRWICEKQAESGKKTVSCL